MENHGRHGTHGKKQGWRRGTGTQEQTDPESPSCSPSVSSVFSGKRQASLVVLVNCNVFTMIRDRKSCSRPRSGWERSRPLKLGEANARAVASRELGSASLHKTGSGQSAGYDEARTGGVASISRTHRTPRGERRQRARIEPAGTWEARSGVQRGQPLTGSHNRRRGRIAASEGRIVVTIRRSSRRGAKAPWPASSRVRRTWN
jgi:hypothetical protein